MKSSRSILIARSILWSLVFCVGQMIFAQENIRIAMAGDAIITRKLSVYDEPEFLRMIELIRDSDAAFVNLEILFHDYEYYPMHQSGGTYMRSAPGMAKELKWAGFDLVSMANNHTGDYGIGGMRSTIKYVEEAGLIHAGAGESPIEAREAKFLETDKGRIALISCSSTFPDHSRAGVTRGDIPPRPGLNPLRYRTTYIVGQAEFEQLKAIGDTLGLISGNPERRMRLFGKSFEVGDTLAIRTEPNQTDVNALRSVVRNAAKLADIVIVSVHAHERNQDLSVPAEFLVSYSRAMIDAGADIIVGHGPHVLRGIEIYEGKPILYSLGDFMFQNETLDRLPSENYERYNLGPTKGVADFNAARYRNDSVGFPARPKVWEGLVAIPTFNDGSLLELELHPIFLGFGKPIPERGRPMLATGDLANKIIQDIADLSKTFGTEIKNRNGIGVVQIEN